MKFRDEELDELLASYTEYEITNLTQEDFTEMSHGAISFIKSSTESILDYVSGIFKETNPSRLIKPMVAGNAIKKLRSENYNWMVQKDTIVSNIPGLSVRMPAVYGVLEKEFLIFTETTLLPDRVENVRKFLTDDEFRIGFRLDQDELKNTDEVLEESQTELESCFGGKNNLDTTTFNKLYGNMSELEECFIATRKLEQKDIRKKVEEVHEIYVEYDEYAREIVKFLDTKPKINTGNIKALMFDMRLAAVGFTQFGKLVNLLVMADNCILDAYRKLKK